VSGQKRRPNEKRTYNHSGERGSLCPADLGLPFSLPQAESQEGASLSFVSFRELMKNRVDPETLRRFARVWDQVAKGESWPLRPGESLPKGPSTCVSCGTRITPENWFWVSDREHVMDICQRCESKRVKKRAQRHRERREAC